MVKIPPRETLFQGKINGQDIFFTNDNVITKPNHRQVQRVHLPIGSAVHEGEGGLHGGIREKHRQG